jgi:hypothetical protein
MISGDADCVIVRVVVYLQGADDVATRARNCGFAGVAGVAVVARRVVQISVVGSAVYRKVTAVVRCELRACPIREAVAATTAAGRRQTSGGVIRIACALIIELVVVAIVAIGGGRRVVTGVAR